MAALRCFFALLVVASPRLVIACSCVGVVPLCQVEFNSLDPSNTKLFIGRVKTVSPKSWEEQMQMIMDRLPEELKKSLATRSIPPAPSEQDESLFFEASKQLLLDLHGSEMTPEQREEVRQAKTETELSDWPLQKLLTTKRVEVEVQEVFVGELPDTVVLRTGLGGGDCGVGFQEGETWLIHAHGDVPTPLGVSGCSRTERLDGASEDLKALRAWKEGGSLPPRAYGVVEDWTQRQDSYPGFPTFSGLRLRLTGGGKTLETVTDANGRFWFEDLQATLYQLQADQPGWSFSGLSQPRLHIDLTQDRCAELFLTMEQDQGTIRGRVLPQPGESLPKYLPIEAIPVERDRSAPFDATATAPEGAFAIDEIEPGDYYVGINIKNAPTGEHSREAKYGRIWPYPPTYYPGVTDRSRAAVFRVERGVTVELGDWTLPPRLSERRLSGVVLRTDGSRVAGAGLLLTIPHHEGRIATLGPTGEDGGFEVYALDGISYELQAAYVDHDADTVLAGSVTIGPESSPPVVVRLEPVPEADLESVAWIFDLIEYDW